MHHLGKRSRGESGRCTSGAPSTRRTPSDCQSTRGAPRSSHATRMLAGNERNAVGVLSDVVRHRRIAHDWRSASACLPPWSRPGGPHSSASSVSPGASRARNPWRALPSGRAASCEPTAATFRAISAGAQWIIKHRAPAADESLRMSSTLAPAVRESSAMSRHSRRTASAPTIRGLRRASGRAGALPLPGCRCWHDCVTVRELEPFIVALLRTSGPAALSRHALRASLRNRRRLRWTVASLRYSGTCGDKALDYRVNY